MSANGGNVSLDPSEDFLANWTYVSSTNSSNFTAETSATENKNNVDNGMTAVTIPVFVELVLAAIGIPCGWIFGQAVCAITRALYGICGNTSILFMIAMSIERYQAVANPIKHHQRSSKKRTWLISAGLWLVSLIFTIQVRWSEGVSALFSRISPGTTVETTMAALDANDDVGKLQDTSLWLSIEAKGMPKLSEFDIVEALYDSVTSELGQGSVNPEDILGAQFLAKQRTWLISFACEDAKAKAISIGRIAVHKSFAILDFQRAGLKEKQIRESFPRYTTYSIPDPMDVNSLMDVEVTIFHDGQKVNCKSCKADDHVFSDCPHRVTCHNCGKKGHIRKWCRAERKDASNETNRSIEQQVEAQLKAVRRKVVRN
ncbi:hypothetical protein Bbelb_193480 [Branchiostoma belcheri]|nr:hypothetical protein Bbelb_193480 [Branchiostoma belcheri]